MDKTQGSGTRTKHTLSLSLLLLFSTQTESEKKGKRGEGEFDHREVGTSSRHAGHVSSAMQAAGSFRRWTGNTREAGGAMEFDLDYRVFPTLDRPFSFLGDWGGGVFLPSFLLYVA